MDALNISANNICLQVPARAAKKITSDNYSSAVEKKTRMNLDLTKNEEKLFQAQDKWDTEAPCTVHDNHKKLTNETFTVLVNIPIGSLKHYLYKDNTKWIKIGHSVGCNQLVTVK